MVLQTLDNLLKQLQNCKRRLTCSSFKEKHVYTSKNFNKIPGFLKLLHYFPARCDIAVQKSVDNQGEGRSNWHYFGSVKKKTAWVHCTRSESKSWLPQFFEKRISRELIDIQIHNWLAHNYQYHFRICKKSAARTSKIIFVVYYLHTIFTIFKGP